MVMNLAIRQSRVASESLRRDRDSVDFSTDGVRVLCEHACRNLRTRHLCGVDLFVASHRNADLDLRRYSLSTSRSIRRDALEQDNVGWSNDGPGSGGAFHSAHENCHRRILS